VAEATVEVVLAEVAGQLGRDLLSRDRARHAPQRFPDWRPGHLDAIPAAPESDSDHSLYQFAEHRPKFGHIGRAQHARPIAGGPQHIVERRQAQVSP